MYVKNCSTFVLLYLYFAHNSKFDNSAGGCIKIHLESNFLGLIFQCQNITGEQPEAKRITQLILPFFLIKWEQTLRVVLKSSTT